MVRGDIDTLGEDQLTDIFNTNVIAGMLLTGLCKPHLAKQDGAIIFIGSIHTRRAFPGPRLMQQPKAHWKHQPGCWLRSSVNTTFALTVLSRVPS